MESWIEAETNGCTLLDERLKARFRTLLGSLSQHVGEPLPLACQDWAATKAAYRFFDNPNVNEDALLAGHFEAVRARFSASSGVILVLHDTTEFAFKRKAPQLIGHTGMSYGGRDKKDRARLHTLCGMLMHSSLVTTVDGLPLGLSAVKFWTRKRFKGTNALRGKVNRTRISIDKKESIRWLENVRQSTSLLGNPTRCVHIGDRESDIYELFCLTQQLGTHFLVRACVNRRAGEKGSTLRDAKAKAAVVGQHCIDIEDADRNSVRVVLQVRLGRLMVHPPIGKPGQYPSLELTFIHAVEEHKPKGRQRIDWKVLTDLPVDDLYDAIEKLTWYSQRWKIETFHKILKSVCHPEESKLRTAERLINLLAVQCVLGWRVFWLCMMNRASPNASATVALTPIELDFARARGWQANTGKTVDRLPMRGPDRQARRLLGSRQRSAAGQYGDMEGALKIDRHPPWIFPCTYSHTCG